MGPTAASFHFSPTCRYALSSRGLIEVELTREQVRWKWLESSREWWPSHLEIPINGKIRQLGPCTICCPADGPRDALRYSDYMAWLVRKLGAVPPKAPRVVLKETNTAIEKLNELPGWVQEIVDGVKHRTVLWQALNGLPQPELRPEDLQIMRLVQALASGIRTLEAVVGSATLDEAKAVAMAALALLREWPQR